jgi:hypothetical protein
MKRSFNASAFACCGVDRLRPCAALCGRSSRHEAPPLQRRGLVSTKRRAMIRLLLLLLLIDVAQFFCVVLGSDAYEYAVRSLVYGLGVAVPTAMILIWLWVWDSPSPLAGVCSACGYDLRGTPSGGACPECGTEREAKVGLKRRLLNAAVFAAMLRSALFLIAYALVTGMLSYASAEILGQMDPLLGANGWLIVWAVYGGLFLPLAAAGLVVVTVAKVSPAVQWRLLAACLALTMGAVAVGLATEALVDSTMGVLTLVALLLAWVVFLMLFLIRVRWLRTLARESPGVPYCPACRYDLRGTPSGGACPECGAAREAGPA